MKVSTATSIAILAGVASVNATPVPAIVYETDIEYSYVTVYGDGQPVAAPAPTSVEAVPAPAPPAPSSHSHSDAAAAPAVVTVSAPAPAPPAPSPETTSQAAAPAPSPATTLSVQAAASSPASAPALSSYQQQVVDSHNTDRSKHSAPSMEWNNTLASYAQSYLDNQNCVFAHSGGPYGENIALGYSSPSDAIAAWYNEVSQYNFALGQFGENTGHFTQVVWKDSTQVGCATVQCNGQQFFACEYYPRGNIIGEFLENVFPN